MTTPSSAAGYKDRLVLAVADRMRDDPESLKPFDLWIVADDQSCHARPERLRMLRHAYVHADLLRREDGSPYEVCPFCSVFLVEVAA